ncbi:hypothetical protein B6N58_03165 [Legionella micdadei]|uniref:Smr domain protein n=1 Tax=Legionella micdadei TaxID=451 RepID=A0A098GHB1_LEGMI|nr:hypothetical protein [Legionella micdadei]ARG96746.1 hypothetical protein B6N58_03165 [Legionella micdadei]KTD26414.1 putative Smr domain protein [Legionella micdadei]NSL17993.1 hypothetical protein [Legionella micdadei]CEG61873.1 conserved protein of unknown function [Legionella micdadei]SCY26059.1 hypothetical protein SAMN02982997_01247 [Legionella micdadei]
MNDFNRTDIDFPTRSPTGNRGESILKDETWQMENQRRLEEKNGHRKLGVKVHEREHYEPQQAAGLEEDLQNGIKEHPFLDNPYFDGIANNENPNPHLSTREVLTKFENERREQDLQHKLKLGLVAAPKFNPNPNP